MGNGKLFSWFVLYVCIFIFLFCLVGSKSVEVLVCCDVEGVGIECD